MFKMRVTLAALFLFNAISSLAQETSGPAIETYSAFFKEFKEEITNSPKLWNKELYGEILLVDPKTREVFANQQDAESTLKEEGNVYTGILPQNINIANTVINWQGKRWAMMMLPLPKDRKAKTNLVAHESFHRIQPLLGFELSNKESNHLDKKGGRIYLRLELEALRAAVLATSSREQQKHLRSALLFRKYRHSLYTNADLLENDLELNEGLAEFTGLMLSNRDRKEITNYTVNGISNFLKNETFVRSFAYHTTPLYGYLLFQKNSEWNKEIKSSTNLTDYFIKSFSIIIPEHLEKEVVLISNDYDGKKILKEEELREEAINKRIATYKSTFVEAPHFDIKFIKMNISFNPTNIVPIEDYGTVYPTMRVTDQWGVLIVENGALMSVTWDKVSLTLPLKTEGNRVSGDGWTLELKEPYKVEQNKENQNYSIVKKAP